MSQVLARSALPPMFICLGWLSLIGTRTVVLEGGRITDDSNAVETTIHGSGQFMIPRTLRFSLHVPGFSALENATSYGLT